MQNNNLLEVKTFLRPNRGHDWIKRPMKKEEVEVLLALLITMGVPTIRYAQYYNMSMCICMMKVYMYHEGVYVCMYEGV